MSLKEWFQEEFEGTDWRRELETGLALIGVATILYAIGNL